MPKLTDLTDRVNRSKRHLSECQLCEHRCRANRIEGERGPCKAGTDAGLFRHRIEYGEELQLIPSHLFYLSGCDLRCLFCIAEANAFNPLLGQRLQPEKFADAVRWGKSLGARNVQWVGGEPTIHIPAILSTMAGCDALPPIVWKSDFHGTPTTFDLLNGIVDVYVADFKFGNDECAHRIASVSNYFGIVTRNLDLAASQADLIVRHLLLPGHFECCFRPIVCWMERHLPAAKFSIRDGYLPRWRSAQDHDLAHPLARDAGHNARVLASQHGLNLVI